MFETGSGQHDRKGDKKTHTQKKENFHQKLNYSIVRV